MFGGESVGHVCTCCVHVTGPHLGTGKGKTGFSAVRREKCGSVRWGCVSEISVILSGMGKTIQYPTRFTEQDADLRADLESSSRMTGQSVNQLILACVRVALPRVVESLSPGAGRITNVDPLPDKLARAAYEQPERDEPGIDRLIAAQAEGGRD